MSRRPYLIACYSKTPNKNNNKLLDVREVVYFETKVSKNKMLDATNIIDLLSLKVIKTRFDDPHEEIVEYYVKKYNKKIQEAIMTAISKYSIRLTEEEIENCKKVSNANN